jgi:hypothetical protein
MYPYEIQDQLVVHYAFRLSGELAYMLVHGTPSIFKLLLSLIF